MTKEFMLEFKLERTQDRGLFWLFFLFFFLFLFLFFEFLFGGDIQVGERVDIAFGGPKF
jgi:hypothetical protein